MKPGSSAHAAAVTISFDFSSSTIVLTKIADEQSRRPQQSQNHILLHLHIIRYLPSNVPQSVEARAEQCTPTEPFASFVRLVLGSSKSAIPIELALCWTAVGVRGPSGAEGGASLLPFGGIANKSGVRRMMERWS